MSTLRTAVTAALPLLKHYENQLASSLSSDSRSHDGDRENRQLLLDVFEALEATDSSDDPTQRAEQERDNWMNTAAQHLRNEEWLRNLLEQAAAHFGDACYRMDDGSLNETVFVSRVPEAALQVTDALRKAAEELIAETRRADHQTRRKLTAQKERNLWHAKCVTRFRNENRLVGLLAEATVALDEIAKCKFCFGPGCTYCETGAHPPSHEAILAAAALKKFNNTP